jgi:hypothetical protein
MAGETRPLQSEDKGRVPRSQMLGQQETRMPVLEVLTAFASDNALAVAFGPV